MRRAGASLEHAATLPQHDPFAITADEVLEAFNELDEHSPFVPANMQEHIDRFEHQLKTGLISTSAEHLKDVAPLPQEPPVAPAQAGNSFL